MKKRLFFAVLLGVFLCTACTKENKNEGVVATVNGRAIHFSELEARYDLDNLSWAGSYVPSVEALREDFGRVLSELIINELINQALEEAHLSITDEDVAEAEAVVRSDYPEGQFEQFLVEEYIDLEVWRKMFRQQLATERFRSEVLRPQVKLTYQEAEAYYMSHVSDFYLPPRTHFRLISAPVRDHVEKARAMYLEHPDVQLLRDTFDEIIVRELKMRNDRLPVTWGNALATMQPGDVGAISSTENGFEALVMVERLPEKLLGPSQAYPLVEKVLLEQKLQEAFSQWLTTKLEAAKITVSKHLLKRAEDEAATKREASDTQAK